jgi:hypothetical protein
MELRHNKKTKKNQYHRQFSQDKLQAIKTPECLPGIQIFSLGNPHVQEVIVDRKIYLCSSHNWLSY